MGKKQKTTAGIPHSHVIISSDRAGHVRPESHLLTQADLQLYSGPNHAPSTKRKKCEGSERKEKLLDNLLSNVQYFQLGRKMLRDRSRRYRRFERHRSQFLAQAISVLRLVRYLRQRNSVASISGGGDEGFNRLLLEGEESLTPKGYLAVYVGGGEEDEPPKRYLVSVCHFNHPLFVELLKEAEKEFGFHHPRGITIPCPAWRFERIQTRIAAGSAVARQKRGCRIF